MRRRTTALLAAAVLALSACSPPQEPVSRQSSIDVDTPSLRALREDAGLAACRDGSGDPVQDGLPDITLPCLGGGDEVTLSSLRGPLVVNAWASWCEPCRRELPLYARLAATGKVDVLGVNWQDPQPDNALRLLADTGVTYPSLADPDGLMRLAGLPVIFLIDEEGRVVYREYVEIRSWRQLRGLVREHLGVRL